MYLSLCSKLVGHTGFDVSGLDVINLLQREVEGMRKSERSEILADIQSVQLYVSSVDWNICNIHGYNWRHVIVSDCTVMENRNLWFVHLFFRS
jgi:hypothetical protein